MKTARKAFGPVKEGTRRRSVEYTTIMNIKNILQRKDVKFKKSLQLRGYGHVARMKTQEC
jgi:hypothetical protein